MKIEGITETPIAVTRADLLGTGSTLLNLLFSGNPFGGFLRGKYFFFVGDSASGKTFLSMTCAAESTINPDFQNYRVIYDNVEDGMLMNLDSLFSEATADKVEPPATANGAPVFSETGEQFYYHLDDALLRAGWDNKNKKMVEVKDARPFIYILDSENGLDTDAADKKFYEHKAAARKEKKAGDKEAAGSYGDGKAKMHSQDLRRAMKGLRKTGSILIVLSQTRDNISGYGERKTRAGGRALRFYATVECWFTPVEQIKKNVQGKERKVGVRVKGETKKNRITGKLGEVEIDIFPSFGIDDIGTCVDYLVEEGFWPASSAGRPGLKARIDARALGQVGTRDKLIRFIERHGLEDKVRELCGQCWAEIDAASALKRKNRYQREVGDVESD
jgi:RecA/RadA recombinase